MNNLNQLKSAVLLDLRQLSELGVNTKQTIKKVESGVFDDDIIEFYDGGMSITEISNFIFSNH
jgi:hypothetical protein